MPGKSTGGVWLTFCSLFACFGPKKRDKSPKKHQPQKVVEVRPSSFVTAFGWETNASFRAAHLQVTATSITVPAFEAHLGSQVGSVSSDIAVVRISILLFLSETQQSTTLHIFVLPAACKERAAPVCSNQP